MGKCHTEDDKRWKSKVGGMNDGKIFIDEEEGDGSFRGKHEDTNEELEGNCLETSETDRSDKIRFVVRNNRHLYVGVFISPTTIEGFRINLATLDVNAPPLNGDEDWVATKGT